MIWKLRRYKKLQTKKFLAILMAMLMTIGMVGCGSTPAASSSEPSRSSEATPPSSETESLVVESEVEDSTELLETEDDAEAEEEETMVDNSEEQECEEATTEPPTSSINSGITVCVWRNAGLGSDYAIFLIDPETGSYKELNCFSHRNTNDGYMVEPANIYYQNCSAMLSQDAAKLAMTYTDNSTKLHHAGWIDSSGAFFDVPEHLGMQAENEFVAQSHYYSIGFTKDGEYFVFAEIVGDHSSMLRSETDFDKFYYVSLNDLSTVYEGNPIRDEAKKGHDDILYALTDWVSDTEYLVDLSDNCIIRSVDNPGDGDVELVPGETRRNYNAIVGPDGRIAFASSIKKTGEDLAIYVTDRGGNSPQKVFGCNVFTAPNGKFPDGYIIVHVMWWK